ncbi:MAG: ABC transporter substrate-binding protein [Bacteroidota bacterium]
MKFFFKSVYVGRSSGTRVGKTLPPFLPLHPIWFALLILLLAACNAPDHPASELRVFRYNQHRSITSLDPAFARSQSNIWAVDHLYDGLLQLDDSLRVRPALAHSWDLSEDGRTYTFHLRGDVRFHDDPVFPDSLGRPLRASDVVYSFSRIIDPMVNSPGSWIFKDRIAVTQAFTAPDDSTFVLRLREAFRPMLGILTMQYCAVVPREAVETYGRDFRTRPVGTGPFRLKKWLEDQALFLLKNEHYFAREADRALPLVDAVRVDFIPDRKTALLELMKGRIDFMSGLESSYAGMLLTSEGDLRAAQREQLQFLSAPFLNMEYLGINMETVGDGPLSHQKVRQAMNFGIDRPRMLRRLRNSVGQAANSGFTPRGLPSFDAQKVPGYSYQPDRARRLLAEAGFPNGEGLGEIELLTSKDYLDLCTFITRQWEDLGLKVKIELVESAVLRGRMRKGQAPFFRASWIADYPDAESFFTMFYSANPAPPNYTHFRDSEFDRLYEAALRENDDERRYALYHRMDARLIELAPVIFLFYDESAFIARREVTGLSQNAINLLNLRRVQKDRESQ